MKFQLITLAICLLLAQQIDAVKLDQRSTDPTEHEKEEVAEATKESLDALKHDVEEGKITEEEAESVGK